MPRAKTKGCYLFPISQDENSGWDTYDSAVVVAVSACESRAKTPDAVKMVRLGPADDPTPRVVCASFNAG